MKNIGFLVLFLTMLGCQTKKVDIKNLDKNGPVIIQFARQACFGKCPIYNFSVYENGLLIYNGERFVEKEGTYYQVLVKSTVDSLVNTFETSSFSSFSENYPTDKSAPSDLPTIELSYRNKKGIVKKVCSKGWGAPDELVLLQQKVDSLLSFQQMTKK